MKKYFLIFLVLILIQKGTFANNTYKTDYKMVDEFSSYEGLIIESIIIDNRNVYDTDSPAYDSYFFKLGNKLHIKTKRQIISKELLFKVGDKFKKADAEETTRNLRNHLSLYDAWLEVEITSENKLIIKIVTVDVWSLKGGFNVIREGNENKLRIGIEEKNLFGLNKIISFDYVNHSDDGNYYEANYSDFRAIKNRYALDINYSGNPLNNYKILSITKPFYNLTQKYSMVFLYKKIRARKDEYSDNIKIAEYNQKAEDFVILLYYRTGSKFQKLTFGINYNYHLKSVFNENIIQYQVDPTELFPSDSLYHLSGLYLNYSNFSYITKKNLDGIGVIEDYTTGIFITNVFKRAFKPNFKNYDYDVYTVSNSLGISNNLLLLMNNVGYKIYFHNSSVLRRIYGYLSQIYLKPNESITFAVQSKYLIDKPGNNNEILILGGTTGVRGYDKFYLTGAKRLTINFESRFISKLKIMSVLFGGVFFVDYGKIWKYNRTNEISSFGIGLRIGFDKASHNIIRIDYSRTKSGVWELSIGTGQYFQAGHLLFSD